MYGHLNAVLPHRSTAAVHFLRNSIQHVGHFLSAFRNGHSNLDRKYAVTAVLDIVTLVGDRPVITGGGTFGDTGPKSCCAQKNLSYTYGIIKKSCFPKMFFPAKLKTRLPAWSGRNVGQFLSRLSQAIDPDAARTTDRNMHPKTHATGNALSTELAKLTVTTCVEYWFLMGSPGVPSEISVGPQKED